MTALFNPSPLVLGTLQNLSLVLDRSTALARGQGVSGLAPGRGEARAFGGLDMTINRTGQSMPAKIRYGAITIAPRAQGSAYSKSPGVHPAIDRAYDNPGVRFGDRVKGGERPTSAAGEISCHFSQTSVSKTSPIREMIKAARSGRRLTGSRAAAHVLYVEREGAPEQIKKRGEERLQGEAFTAEIERRSLDRSPVAQQAYIERAGAAEGIEPKPGRAITDEDLDALDEASFGTIGETVEERTRFWIAVEDAEATPKGDRITIKPRDNPEWWAKVAEAVDGAPSAAQRPIRDALARDDGEPFELKLATDKAFAVHQWAVGLDTEAPIEISPGRGGRTQTRVIAELPHELDGRDRLQIVRDFTQKLAEKGFPYWAVIHAPDANNDARNYHVHIAYYDRPAAKVTTASGKEVWDFEILEEVTWKNRTKHLIRTQQQNRLRETNNQDWVTDLRKHWETVSNRVLEDAGVSKRYNLGTYESMGIDLEPLKHINSRTFNKERKGELTEEGPVLARRQWDNVHDRLVKDHEQRARKRQTGIENLGDYAERVVRTQPHGQHRVTEVKRLREMGVKASFQLALAELHQDLTRLVSDRVASRPKLIMNAADKEEQKTRKKKGLALDAPPEDRPVAGAGLFGLQRRSEIAKFLTTIYDGALMIDRDNAMRSKKAQSNVRLIVQELKDWIAQPGRPLHQARRYSAEPLQGLDDPARLERREAMREALARGFRDAAEQASQQILESIKQSAAQQSSAPVPAPAPDQLHMNRTGPATSVGLDRSNSVQGQSGVLARAAPQAVSTDAPIAPGKPRYVPGRPESEVRTTNRDVDRPRAGAPRIDLAFIQSALSPIATMRLPVATPAVQPRRANTISDPSRPAYTSVPTRSNPTSATPAPASSEFSKTPEADVHKPSQPAGSTHPAATPSTRTETPKPIVRLLGEVAPAQRNSQATPAEKAGPPTAGNERLERPVDAATSIMLQAEAAPQADSSPPAREPTNTAAPTRASAAATQSHVPPAGSSPAKQEVAPSIPARTAQPGPTEASMTPTGATAAARQTVAATPSKPSEMAAAAGHPGQTKLKVKRSHCDSIPVLAEVMEGRVPARSIKPQPPEAPKVQAAPLLSPVEMTEIKIVGAKRPEKKRRERDRGRER